MASSGRLDISNTQESIAKFAERYEWLSQPHVIEGMMREFTGMMSATLARNLSQHSKHPRDTGTLQGHWYVSKQKLQSNHGPTWYVEAENNATIGEQHIAKTGRALYTSGRRRNKRGNPQFLANATYLKYVPEAMNLYNKEIRILAQKVPAEFRKYIEVRLHSMIAKLPRGYRLTYLERYMEDFRTVKGWDE